MSLNTLIRDLSDNTSPGSLANRFRRRRFQWFLDMTAGIGAQLERPITVLDVGGTPDYWVKMGVADDPGYSITSLNVDPVADLHPNIRATIGDATDLADFRARAFDVAYSNSVIEHVGGIDEQAAMAVNVCRVADHYMVQTPCRTFPMEPHFQFPWFALLPRRIRVWLLMTFPLGWERRRTERVDAERVVDGVRLLSRRQLQSLFPPDATLRRERVLGMTKSFVVMSPVP
jgi:hypothetical protein